MNNHIHYEVRTEITYPFPNVNDATIEVWGWISKFIPHFTGHAITYPWCVYKRPLWSTKKVVPYPHSLLGLGKCHIEITSLAAQPLRECIYRTGGSLDLHKWAFVLANYGPDSLEQFLQACLFVFMEIAGCGNRGSIPHKWKSMMAFVTLLPMGLVLEEDGKDFSGNT